MGWLKVVVVVVLVVVAAAAAVVVAVVVMVAVDARRPSQMGGRVVVGSSRESRRLSRPASLRQPLRAVEGCQIRYLREVTQSIRWVKCGPALK